MVRFQTQGPGVALQMPNWDTEYKRQTPFKQAVGLYNMWQSLSPDTRNWLASLFKGDDYGDEELPPRDEILDVTVNPEAGTLERFGDNDWREVGNIQYVDSPDAQPTNPFDVEVGGTDPWGISNISTKPAKSKVRKDRYPALTLSRADIADPAEFLQPQDSTSFDLPAGHYDNAWRGLL